MSRITVYQDGLLIADSGAAVPVDPPPINYSVCAGLTMDACRSTKFGGTFPQGWDNEKAYSAGVLRPAPPSTGTYTEGHFAPGKGQQVPLNLSDGQIVCLPLPGWDDLGQKGTIVVGDNSSGRPFAGLGICISQTKGLIDPAGNYQDAGGTANYIYLNGDDLPPYYYVAGKPMTKAQILAHGWAWCPKSAAPWFVNIKAHGSGSANLFWNN